MAKPATDKVVPLRSDASPSFQFGALDIEHEPEVNLTSSRASHAAAGDITQGIDLSGVPRIILLAGRGRSGKTTNCRFMAERALSAGRPLLMGDMDPTNASFSSYFEGVHRPPNADSPAAVLKWLEQFIAHAIKHHLTAAIDLGGGDTVLRRLVDELPDLAQMTHDEGSALVMLYHVGPQLDDLSPIAAMADRGFHAEATAIIMNEALVDAGQSREEAFMRLKRHSVYKNAIDLGANQVWMPRLFAADIIEARRAHFAAAADGQAGLTPFDSARVRHWLAAMERQFAGISTWLP